MARRRLKLASHSGANECHRCGKDIENTRDMAKVKGRFIHKTCAGGGDDE